MKNNTKRIGAKSILPAAAWRAARAGSRFLLLLFCASLLAQAAALAQTTVNLINPGRLKDEGVSRVSNLVVTGLIDARDVKYMRDNMAALTSVDLSGAIVVSYRGTEGTMSETTTYPANEMPQRSFYNGSTGKTSLTSVKLPAGLTSIGIDAFRSCSNLTGSFTLPSGVNAIGSYAFADCIGFTGTLNLPSGLEILGAGAFSGCYNFTGALNLPAGLKSISDYAFEACTNFRSLTLPSELTSIGSYAFQDCTNFGGPLILPAKLTSIGAYAFYYCSNFTSLTLPDGLTSIGTCAFESCKGFSGPLILPAKLTYMGGFAFQDCFHFSSLTLPDSLTTIGLATFSDCRGFTGSLTLPSELTTINNYAFYNCTGFTGSLILPSKVTFVGQHVFSGCGFNGPLVLPAGLTSIGNSAFSSCSNFTAVYSYNPKPVSMDYNASVFASGSFMDSVSLYVPCTSKSRYQSSNVWKKFKNIRCIEVLSETFEGGSGTTLAGWDFANVSQLNKWHVATAAANGPAMEGSKGGYISNNGGSHAYTVASTSVAHLHHGELFLSADIGYHLTFDWKGVGELGYDDLQVFLVDNATTPAAGTPLNASYALLGGLCQHPAWRTEKVTLPVLAGNGNRRLVFSWRNNGSAGVQPPAAIDNVVIAAVPEVDSLTVHLTQAGTLADAAGEVAVRRKLTVTGPIDARDVRFIRDAMTGLAALNLSGATVVAYTGTEGTAFSAAPVTYPANEMPQYSFYNNLRGKESLTSVKLPAGLTSIGGHAFRDCYRLAGSLTLPSGITSIGDNAFYSCSGFTGTLTLPAGLTYLGARAFYSCSSFTGSLALPAGITSIGDYTFYSCANLFGTLTLPAKLTSIGASAFEGCYRLTGRLTLPGSLTFLGERAFYGCKSFTGSLTLPSKVASIGNNAFQNCTGFDGSLTLSVGLTYIGASAFESCNKLNGSLILPNNLTRINDGAFSDCFGFTSVTLPAGLTSIGNNAFRSCTSLDTVYNYCPTPQAIEANVFTSSARAGNMHLYVPCASYGNYQTASVWRTFNTIMCIEGVPTAPQNFAATPDSAKVTLSWLAPASNGGSAITKYEVKKGDDGWITASSSTGHTFTGLVNGKSYTFQVRAVNVAGGGTAAILTDTPRAGPDAPQRFAATPDSAKVTLSWSAPASNGGSAITGYKVQKNNDGWITASSSTGHTFTGLTNGTAYTFKVRAVNAVGDGVAAILTETPRTVPTAPQRFAATPDSAKVTLSWLAPASNGGSAVTGYKVKKGDDGWITASSSTGHTFTGLVNGKS
ncbi:MAG: fibronectin type III domain-containing protein, partial [Prevotellaceae bacterium]|nr:fibronectin type III domain-containing protein [Prevotellaceae bacterium]